ncbi:hypothetical protein H9P43_009500 [Blastocladiella emersonii ATCC 22665]|nr:hypothetical protein H9P43_009490 [Blastocladiella emersonii ATCC 22665]KAI9152704.1 hypothetical protein H9P43_009500 [Blastocladiella emersonii ATCC 22665]
MTLGVLILNGLINANKGIIFIPPVVMVQHWNPDLKLAEGVVKGQIKTSHLSNLTCLSHLEVIKKLLRWLYEVMVTGTLLAVEADQVTALPHDNCLYVYTRRWGNRY